MIPAVVSVVAQAMTAAVTATGRPVMTLFAVQAMVGAAVRMGAADVHAVVEPMVSFLAIAVMGVFAVVESVIQHQSEVAEVLDDLFVQRIGGAASAMVSTLLLATVGAPGQPPSGEVAEIIQIAHGSTHSAPLTIAAIGLAAVVSLGLGWVRALVLESLRDADMDGPYQWLETGGVVTALVLLPLLPLVALGLVIAVSVALVAVAIVARTTEWLVDKNSRRPCSACGHGVRVEASVCPECSAELEVVFSLAYSLAERPVEQPA